MHLFRTRVRRVGNSLGVIVPREAIEEAGIAEGEEVDLAIVPTGAKRKRMLAALVGSATQLDPFQRDHDDRF